MGSSNSTASKPNSGGSHRKTTLLVNGSSPKSKADPPTCVVCNEPHASFRCSRFVEASPKQRFDWLKKWKACRNCLSYHHTAKECKSTWHCKVCPERHNTLLHLGARDSSQDSSSSSDPQAAASSNQKIPASSLSALNAISPEDSEVLLGTALAEIKDGRGEFQRIRMVIDCGSQFSFVTRRFSKRLGLEIQSAPRAVGAIGRTVFEGARGMVWCMIKPVNRTSPHFQTFAVVLNEIVCDLPNFPVPDSIFKQYAGYNLADPKFWETQPIDFLLGCDLYPEICRDGIVSLNPDWPRLFPSAFGYIVAGKLPAARVRDSTITLSAVVTYPTLQDELHRFWEIEETGCVNPSYTKEEEQCMAHFRDTHSRTDSGQCVVRLPFREDAPTLGDSGTPARRRFYSLEGKLLKDPPLREKYVKFMREYCDTYPTTAPSQYVIPHHSVAKEDRGQIKLRVVFDASSKTPFGLLNDHLLIGPKLQKDISTILMNFRRHAVVFTTDVVKMYRFILMDPKDRPYQHILWRFDHADSLQKYELATLAYGPSPAPFLALSVMRQLCEDEGHKYPKAAEVVLRDMYIDDIASGASSLEEALDLQQQLIGLLGQGTFKLSKWSSNKQEILDAVAGTNDLPIDLSTNDDHTVKILGLQWDPVDDCFSYRVQPPAIVFTKRSIASAIAKIYDPLGLVSPVIVSAKSKLAPVKTISVPRLELCGALLLTRTLTAVTPFLAALPTETPDPICYTDSTVVLGWLAKPSYVLKTFVANRVTNIVESAPASRWRHVRSQDNPSDINSRGLTPSQLESCSLWWRGPPWLLDPPDLWPNEFPALLGSDLPELKASSKSAPQALAAMTSASPLLCWMSTFSSFMKLLRFFSWVRRWIIARKSKVRMTRGPILPSELRGTTVCCAKYLQQHFFYEHDDEKAEKKMHARFGNLKAFKDSRGIFRVGGRIGKAIGIPYSQKHPILLPQCHFTDLLVDHYHLIHMHPGPGLLQALIQLQYWVPSLRTLIRRQTFLCVRCFSAKAQALEAAPQMGDLPGYRLAGGRAFLHTGVDFAGPYLIRYSLQRKSSLSKVYLCLFICMVTKAVHLEAVTSLSTEAFLACFSRFVSRRCLPEQMYSDCGTNFVGAANQLKEFAAWFNDEETKRAIVTHTAVHNVTWNFNPPGSPHFGGIWEANVKSSKKLISKSLGDTKLTYEELSTLFTQVEAVLNSRPLCPLSSSPEEADFLSPGHFLIGDHLRRPPEPTLLDVNESRLSRWQLVQQMTQYFWTRWRQEYLCTLQQRGKWTEPKENVRVNDLVLLKDKSALDWLLAKIIEVHAGADGTVRVITLKTPQTTLTRPVVQVVPLLPLKQPAYRKLKN